MTSSLGEMDTDSDSEDSGGFENGLSHQDLPWPEDYFLHPQPHEINITAYHQCDQSLFT